MKIDHEDVYNQILNSELIGGYMPLWDDIKDNPAWLEWLEGIEERYRLAGSRRGKNDGKSNAL